MPILLDWNGETGTRAHVDEADGILAIQEIQDCTDVLQKCADERASDVLRGHRKPGSFHCVAEFPLVLVDKLRGMGLDIMNDRDALKRVLNDPEFAAFRTSLGKTL